LPSSGGVKKAKLLGLASRAKAKSQFGSKPIFLFHNIKLGDGVRKLFIASLFCHPGGGRDPRFPDFKA
jgi:hypothetical protein